MPGPSDSPNTDADGLPEWLSPEGRDMARMMAHLGLPISDEGRLPGGDHWTLALRETEDAVFAHLMIRSAGGGAINSEAGRLRGAKHVIDGGAFSGGDGVRAFAWMVHGDVAALELRDTLPPADATAAPLPANAIYDNGQMRLFLIVVDDRDTQLNAAVALDEHHHPLATVDLTDEQQEFTAYTERVKNVRRVGAHAAGPPPHRMVDWPITQHVPDRPPPALT